MKVSFLIPPVVNSSLRPAERSAGCTRVVYPMPNLYELTAAAVAEKRGHEVSLHNFTLPARTPQDFRGWLGQDRSDVYCIWGVNLSMEDDLPAVADIMRLRPEARIVLMGPAPTFFHKRFLTDARIFILRGEPEWTFDELLTAFEMKNGADYSAIAGLSYMSGGRVIHNPSREPSRSFDELPLPARHLLGDTVYHNPKLKLTPYTTLLTSRNCPYRCIYCVPSSLTFARELDYRENHGHKPPISYRSPESVDRELKLLHEQGYKAIGFIDDNFIWNEERTLALCESLKKYGFKWGCQARVDAITEPIAKALAESGCTYVDLGMESFNDEILKYVKKGITSADIYRSVEILQKYGVPVKLNILIGTSPLETRATIKETVRKAKRLDVDQVMINIVSPFPGTELYQIAKANGWIEGGEYRPTDVQRESILNYPNLSARDMEKALFRANLAYFFSPAFIRKQLVRFRSFSEFKAALKALRIKLFG